MKLTVAALDLIQNLSLFINIQFRLHICSLNSPIKYIDNVIDKFSEFYLFQFYSFDIIFRI